MIPRTGEVSNIHLFSNWQLYHVEIKRRTWRWFHIQEKVQLDQKQKKNQVLVMGCWFLLLQISLPFWYLAVVILLVLRDPWWHICFVKIFWLIFWLQFYLFGYRVKVVLQAGNKLAATNFKRSYDFSGIRD